MSLEDDYHQHKLKLRETLTKELDAFDSFIAKDASRGLDSLLDERRKRRQHEIKIRSLESNVQSLRAELDSIKKGSSHIQSTPSDDVVPKTKYDSLQHEFERISRARDTLESRCRRYKEILKGSREHERPWGTTESPRSTTRKTSTAPSFEVKEHYAAENPTLPIPLEQFTPCSSDQASELPSSKSDAACNPGSGLRYPRDCGDQSNVRIEPMLAAHQATSAQSTNLRTNESLEASTEADSRVSSSNQPRALEGFQTLHGGHKVPSLDLDDNDIPVVVSDRSLKRKRSSPKKEANVPNLENKDVKAELATSSPVIALSSRPIFAIQDSLDLDNVGQLLRTPRKGQRLECRRSLPSFGIDSRREFATELQDYVACPHPDVEYAISEMEDKALMYPQISGTRGINHSWVERKSLNGAGHGEHQKGRRQAKMTSGLDSFNDSNITRRRASTVDNQRQISVSNIDFAKDEKPHTKYPLELHQDPVILSSVNPNIISRTCSKPRKAVSSSRRDDGAACLPALAEDGEEFTPSKKFRPSSFEAKLLEVMQGGQSKVTSETGSSNPRRRLDALLHDPSPKKADLPLSKSNLASNPPIQNSKIVSGSHEGISVHRPKHNFFTARINSALHGPRKKRVETNQTPPMKRALSDEKVDFEKPPEVSPEQEPLRVRSIERLRLTDFKLNKNHSEFAFRESIRKHDEKRRIGACRDPFCDRCKEIARFAELTEYVAPPTAGLFDSSPLDADAAEQQLIEEYLGYDKERLKRLSAAERGEILKKAREKSFADMYGKHRQLYNRAVSPPGYWETEFPSTQQEAANREAAKAIEKVRIKERYEEAIKGGLWKFADE